MQDDFIRSDEACALLGVKQTTFYKYVHRGLITSYRTKVGGRRLYSRLQILDLLRVRPAKETSEASVAPVEAVAVPSYSPALSVGVGA